MATKKRRLSDLYVVGRMAYINDDSGGDPVQVWVQKLNALEAETAARKANAARARVLIAARNKESEDWHDIYSEVADLDRDTIANIVIADELSQKGRAIEAELAHSEEWSNDDYLQGLRDSWNDELRRVYEEGDEQADKYDEAKKTFGELKRFGEAVNRGVEAEREHLLKELAEMPLTQLIEQGTGRNISLRGDSAWIKAFHRALIYFGTRDPENTKDRYFDEDEIDQLNGPTLDALYKEFDALNVEVTEGKSLPPTPDSSPQSEQDGEGETADSSGLAAVSQ